MCGGLSLNPFFFLHEYLVPLNIYDKMRMRRWKDVDYQCYNSIKTTNTQTAASTLCTYQHNIITCPGAREFSTVAEAGTGMCLAQRLSVDAAVSFAMSNRGVLTSGWKGENNSKMY